MKLLKKKLKKRKKYLTVESQGAMNISKLGSRGCRVKAKDGRMCEERWGTACMSWWRWHDSHQGFQGGESQLPRDFIWLRGREM